jgi:hypothetical protein
MTQSWEPAQRHFQDALAANARMGARPRLAHTKCDYARLLHARNGRGDRERAQALLDATRETYRQLGMETYSTRAATLAHEAATAP